jgi:hypothetical protein
MRTAVSSDDHLLRAAKPVELPNAGQGGFLPGIDPNSNASLFGALDPSRETGLLP